MFRFSWEGGPAEQFCIVSHFERTRSARFVCLVDKHFLEPFNKFTTIQVFPQNECEIPVTPKFMSPFCTQSFAFVTDTPQERLYIHTKVKVEHALMALNVDELHRLFQKSRCMTISSVVK